MYLESEHNLFKNLKILKQKFYIQGIKTEFEAEGSNQFDIYKLRSLTNKLDIKLYIKIGGVEAVNDIYFCVEVGADGIIAPMVETKFAAKKYLEMLNKIYSKNKPHISINIESVTGVKNIDEILKTLNGFLNNITIGRKDLSSSFFNNKIKPNSNEIKKIIKYICKKNNRYNVTTTVGGGISQKTIYIYKKDTFMKKKILRYETRKVIIDKKFFFIKKDIIKKCLELEKIYILLKKELFDLKMNSEILRLSELKNRV